MQSRMAAFVGCSAVAYAMTSTDDNLDGQDQILPCCARQFLGFLGFVGGQGALRCKACAATSGESGIVERLASYSPDHDTAV